MKLPWGADAGFHLALAWAFASCSVPQFPDLRTFLEDHGILHMASTVSVVCYCQEGRGVKACRGLWSQALVSALPDTTAVLPWGLSRSWVLLCERAVHWACEAWPALPTSLPTFPCTPGHFPLSR